MLLYVGICVTGEGGVMGFELDCRDAEMRRAMFYVVPAYCTGVEGASVGRWGGTATS